MVKRNVSSPEKLKEKSDFVYMLEAQWQKDNFVCVGLDIDLSKIPDKFSGLPVEDAIFEFNREVIEATSDLVCAYKPNSAYYEAYGLEGINGLKRTVQYIKEEYPEVPVIIDAKRGDIGPTNDAYGRAIFDILKADAMTVHPYFGRQSLEPLLARKDKGIIIMGANSNEGADEFQNLPVGDLQEPLYKHIARKVATEWNKNGNCSITAAATKPQKISQIREVVGDMPLLILGIGAQGGDLESTIQAGMDSRGWGMMINATRSLTYPSTANDFQNAVRQSTKSLRNDINVERTR